MSLLIKRKIERLVVHCSATPPTMDIGRDEIDRWHRERGWLGIGYHYVIRRDGTLEYGRPLEKAGAHAKGFNQTSIGICMVGGVDEDQNPENNFNDEQFETLIHLLTELCLVFDAEVLGHRDLPKVNKACPCFDARDLWEQQGITC